MKLNLTTRQKPGRAGFSSPMNLAVQVFRKSRERCCFYVEMDFTIICVMHDVSFIHNHAAQPKQQDFVDGILLSPSSDPHTPIVLCFKQT